MSFKTIHPLYKSIIGLYGTTAFIKTIKMYDAPIVIRNPITSEIEKKQMLLGDKISVIFLSTALSPIVFPITIIDSINRAQIYFQGNKLIDYGYHEKQSVSDYILL